MFHLGFGISWPLKKRLKKKEICYYDVPIKFWPNKAFSFQLDWLNGYSFPIIGFSVYITKYQCHSGILIDFNFLGFSSHTNLYDIRHWDYDKGEWDVYPEEKDIVEKE